MLAIVLSAALAAAPQRPLDPVSASILAEHYLVRAQAGVPPLRWNWQLAADAASYGPTLWAMGYLYAVLRISRPSNVSQNLAGRSQGTYYDAQLIVEWAP